MLPEPPKASYLALKAPVFASTEDKATVTGKVVFDGEKRLTKPLESLRHSPRTAPLATL